MDTRERLGWFVPDQAGNATAGWPTREVLHSTSILQDAARQAPRPPLLPPSYVTQAMGYLLVGGPPPDPPFGPPRAPDDLLAALSYIARGNIPGTNIPDEGRPEDATGTHVEPDSADFGILRWPDPSMDRQMVLPGIPQNPPPIQVIPPPLPTVKKMVKKIRW